MSQLNAAQNCCQTETERDGTLPAYECGCSAISNVQSSRLNPCYEGEILLGSGGSGNSESVGVKVASMLHS